MRGLDGHATALRAYVPAVGGDAPRPLLVMFDGQNVFEDHGSFAGGWHAHLAVERLHPSTIAAPVVLGVANGGVRRVAELGPRVHAFLEGVVAVAVRRAEGALPLSGRRAIAGSSLGGLAALVAWTSRRDLFEHAIAMSPSLWFEHGHLSRALRAGLIAPPPTGRLYLDAGARERGRMFADAELLAEALEGQGLGPERLMWRPDQRGAHHERHWRRRLPKALRFVFRVKGG